jgi:RimJ/RimL family protein N-acetyltransferase
MAFAETARLRIRGYCESDLDKLITLFDDLRTMRGNPEFIVPRNEAKQKTELPRELLEKATMCCVLEAKESLEDGNNLAGVVLLMASGSPKNRDVHLGITLDVTFWGRGYGM